MNIKKKKKKKKKKCVAIPFNMHVKHLRKYNTVFYSNIFIEKT